MNSTNGTIQMQKDDGEDEVTSSPLLSEFNDIKKEVEDDTTFAMKNGMDSIFWCWNCQYSECNRH